MMQWQELYNCNQLHRVKNIYSLTLYRKSLLTPQLDTRSRKKTPTLMYPIVSWRKLVNN